MCIRDSLALRKASGAIRYGSFKDVTKNDGCFVYERALGGEKIVVAVNFEKNNEIILPAMPINARTEILLCNYPDAESSATDFRPFEIRVYRIS